MSDRLEIAKCPICHLPHTYKIAVERSLVVGLQFLSGPPALSPPRRVTYTRIFTCPERNEDFEADITMYDVEGFKIKSVEVIGFAYD